VAHDAQRKLLPKRMPELAGFEIDAISITANEVGGDYYDFFEVEDKLGIAVGDVSGKGAKAAFYMAELKGIIEALSHIYYSPKDLMIQVNRTLGRNWEATTFISLIYAVLDIKKRELFFSRAGHCPLLFCPRRGEPQFMEPRGLGLGLEFGKKFDDILAEQKIKLKTGDMLLLYTDGVVEARNSEQREFDQERLRTVAAKLAPLSARQIKDALVNEIRTFVGQARAHDDLTFVVLKAV
jgi:serine phosphatase RsbU (regulator of sigma subunit)